MPRLNLGKSYKQLDRIQITEAWIYDTYTQYNTYIYIYIYRSTIYYIALYLQTYQLFPWQVSIINLFSKTSKPPFFLLKFSTDLRSRDQVSHGMFIFLIILHFCLPPAQKQQTSNGWCFRNPARKFPPHMYKETLWSNGIYYKPQLASLAGFLNHLQYGRFFWAQRVSTPNSAPGGIKSHCELLLDHLILYSLINNRGSVMVYGSG